MDNVDYGMVLRVTVYMLLTVNKDRSSLCYGVPIVDGLRLVVRMAG